LNGSIDAYNYFRNRSFKVIFQDCVLLEKLEKILYNESSSRFFTGTWLGLAHIPRKMLRDEIGQFLRHRKRGWKTNLSPTWVPSRLLPYPGKSGPSDGCKYSRSRMMDPCVSESDEAWFQENSGDFVLFCSNSPPMLILVLVALVLLVLPVPWSQLNVGSKA
jgi:hypothetical protein